MPTFLAPAPSSQCEPEHKSQWNPEQRAFVLYRDLSLPGPGVPSGGDDRHIKRHIFSSCLCCLQSSFVALGTSLTPPIPCGFRLVQWWSWGLFFSHPFLALFPYPDWDQEAPSHSGQMWGTVSRWVLVIRARPGCRCPLCPGRRSVSVQLLAQLETRLAQLAGWCKQVETRYCSCSVALSAGWANSLSIKMFHIWLDYLQAASEGKNGCWGGCSAGESQIWSGLPRKPRKQYRVLRKPLFWDSPAVLMTVSWHVALTSCHLASKTSTQQW